MSEYGMGVDGQPNVCCEIAPSGVTVYSTVPFHETKWWDYSLLHIIWSWTSWTTSVLAAYGFWKPRKWFESWGRRG